MRIAHVLPVNISKKREQGLIDLLNKVTSEQTKVEVISYEEGPDDLEYYTDDLKAINLMLNDSKRLNKYDAISIACFYDPGIRELREVLDVPVIGIAQASYMLATIYGHSFSVIVGRRKNLPKMKDNAMLYGSYNKIVSWKSLGMTVADLKLDAGKAAKRAEELIEEAINLDSAESVILGCGALSGLEEVLQGKYKIPVINPVIAGITCAEWFANLKINSNLTTSKQYDYEPKDNKLTTIFETI